MKQRRGTLEPARKDSMSTGQNILNADLGLDTRKRRQTTLMPAMNQLLLFQ